jgi:hypothetical protein
VTTEWKATDHRWWPLRVLLSVAVTAAPLLLDHVWPAQGLWPYVVLPVAAVLNLVWAVRDRLRLTDAGVEVRRLRTRVYRWSDIASVERAPAWADPSVIWLRLRGSVPTSAPEELVPPGLRADADGGRALDDIVALVRRRAGLTQENAVGPAWSAWSHLDARDDPAVDDCLLLRDGRLRRRGRTTRRRRR